MPDKLINNQKILVKQLKESGRLSKFRKRYIPPEDVVKKILNMVSDTPMFTNEPAKGAFPLIFDAEEFPDTYVIMEYMPLPSYQMKSLNIPLPRCRLLYLTLEDKEKAEKKSKEVIENTIKEKIELYEKNNDETVTPEMEKELRDKIESQGEGLMIHYWLADYYKEFDRVNIISEKELKDSEESQVIDFSKENND